jgi:hypothetical protein
MENAYDDFFSQFVSSTVNGYGYNNAHLSLFYLAYIEASKHCDMSVIPASLRTLKALKTAIINSDRIYFGTTIGRITFGDKCHMIYPMDVVHKQTKYKTIYIPPSVEYVYSLVPVPANIPPTVKYYTVDCVKEPFTIDIELEYLSLHDIRCNELKATKPIKFLVVSTGDDLHRLCGIIPYVKYIIFRGIATPCFNIACIPKMLICIFAYRAYTSSYRINMQHFPIYNLRGVRYATFSNL